LDELLITLPLHHITSPNEIVTFSIRTLDM
jgi:hypothetical protein